MRGMVRASSASQNAILIEGMIPGNYGDAKVYQADFKPNMKAGQLINELN